MDNARNDIFIDSVITRMNTKLSSKQEHTSRRRRLGASIRSMSAMESQTQLQYALLHSQEQSAMLLNEDAK